MNVTVAIPCYDGARFLAHAVEALLAQSRPAGEIIVVDDGSSDGSASVAARYPVRLLRHGGNRGLAAARNTALAAAGGDVLVFVDVDAYAGADCLEVLLGGYDDGRAAGVGGQGIEVNVRTPADRWRRAHATQGYGDRPRWVAHLHGICMSYRVEALRGVGGFDPAFCTNGEDVEIGLRLNAAGHRLRYLPGARVYHQRGDDEESLRRTMVAWCLGAYRARRANRCRPWRSFAGTLRRMAMDPLHDLLIERDVSLARLSRRICRAKLEALWKEMLEQYP
jgi:GT2 family glycosyltransferase